MPNTDHGDLAADITRTSWALHRALRQSQGTPRGENPRPLAQVEVLKLVDSRPGITVREIAEALRMQANNVSTLISALTKDGFLDRRSDPADARVIQLHPTAKMRAASTELADRLDAGVSDALATLSEQSRTRIASVLPDLRALAQALAAQP
ncbi:MarR family winged helix-turn-helix transcriptional regulator [Nocardia salmonicida]|uniref:MarR family winged helix-turn-helix transcriptional regulator n=1 Tax=Nocardia salmonicida TaxID=53431 RepID=UPI0007A50AFE|nr:MarR family transcriptional regulator [Nocardia salmonicida]